MDPLVKAVLNSLKCPLCGGQIDLLDWRSVKKTDPQYNYCCVADWQHYRLFIDSNKNPGFIEYETVIFYDGKYQYQIVQENRAQSLISFPVTAIWLREVDAENRVLEKKDSRKKSLLPDFSFDKKLFDFSTTNREKVINRVKMIVVFQ